MSRTEAAPAWLQVCAAGCGYTLLLIKLNNSLIVLYSNPCMAT
jgi:hypothetical protein